MSRVRYETLILASPEITSAETEAIEQEFNKLMSKVKGEVISFERWGKLRLAYPVRKSDYGVYFLARFEIGQEGKKEVLDSLHTLLTVKMAAPVMRYINAALEQGQSLEYQRPNSLEDVPTRDVGAFLRENKMGGLMSSAHGDDMSLEQDMIEA